MINRLRLWLALRLLPKSCRSLETLARVPCSSQQVWVVGNLPPRKRTIADMEPGEIGYTVTWAWDEDKSQLRESFSVGSKGGTASLRVECVAKRQYRIEFEQPIYRNPFSGEYHTESKGWLM